MENLHNVSIENKSKITASGVVEVASCTDKAIKLILNDKTVFLISGNNLKIIGFDNKSGNIALTGEILLIKYKPKEESVFKKVFK